MHFFYLESIAFERMPLSLIPSHSSLAFALAKACFTSAHKCTLLGVMPPFSPVALSQTEMTSRRSPYGNSPGRNASRIRKRMRLSDAARIDKLVACFRISGNHRFRRCSDTCLGVLPTIFRQKEKIS